jgi:hypothetical protein
VTLTAADREKIEAKKLANVLRKLNSGGTLTAREEAILQASLAGDPQTPEVGFVQTWDQLAAELSKCGTPITRRAIQEWRRDPRYRDRCPIDRADGRKEVASWLRFMVEHGLKSADLHVDSQPGTSGEPIQPPPIAGSQADWNKAETWTRYRKRAVELEALMGNLLEAADLEVPLGATLATIQAKLAQFPPRVARYLVGLRDVSEVEDRLRDEIDADLGELNSAGYLAENAVEEAVTALLPADKADLRQLVVEVATQALRQLGRREISQATRAVAIEPGEDEPGPEIPEPAAESPEAAPKVGPTKPKRKRTRQKPVEPPGEIAGAIVATHRKARK